MNIGLIGYGKMGKAIETIALKRGHQVTLKISQSNLAEFNTDNLHQVDVAIEFTTPETALNNVLKCLSAGTNVVCGTTGWNSTLSIAENKVIQTKTALLHSSNFSIGVNIFFEVNKLLAGLMNKQPGYEVAITETHHLQKKDAPSGTAITLAEQIINKMDRLSGWQKDIAAPGIIPVSSFRKDHVPGTHHISYSSAIDDIEIIHTAHNRDGFALGAVLAAEFIYGKSGLFTMKDVLGI